MHKNALKLADIIKLEYIISWMKSFQGLKGIKIKYDLDDEK